MRVSVEGWSALGSGECPSPEPTHRIGDTALRVGSGTPVLADSPDCLILGQLFTRSGDPVDQVPRPAQLAMIGSDGRWLVEEYWGRYLAFWRDRRDGAVWALRDPSGALPLYFQNSGTAFFTDPGAALKLGWTTPNIDWAGLAHRLYFVHLPLARTCWTGVREVLPGQAVRLVGGAAARLLWSPWTWVDPVAFEGESAERVASAVRRAVGALTRAARPVVLELSGGLDSSIIAACLGEAGVPWSAATIYPPGRDGDERAYARAVVERLGADLRETAVTPDDVDLLRPPALKRVAPSGFGMIAAINRAQAEAADAAGASAIVSGTGGDNVFCSLRSAAPVLDAARMAGAGRTWRVARDLALLTSTSVPTVAAAALRYAWRERGVPDRWRASPLLLSADCRPPLERHPWLDMPRRRRSGSRAHIVMLVRAFAVLAGIDRARTHDMLFPLLAQPVMEACLSVPSWAWVSDAGDRAVARRAFADALPPIVLARRTKGRLESLLAPAYDRDRSKLAELLLNGHLADAGLIDRVEVAAAIRAPAGVDDTVSMRVMELADAELWAADLLG